MSSNSEVPSGNDTTVIIPSNSSKSGFYRNRYSSEKLNGLLSKEKFDSIINDMSKILSRNHSLRITSERSFISPLEKVTYLLATICAFTFLVM